MIIAAQNPATLRAGQRPGNLVFTGDSLSVPFPADVDNMAWWKCLNVPLKTQPPNGRAVFGWNMQFVNTALNQGIINGFYDSSAPWNALVIWAGAANIVAGDTGASVYALMQQSLTIFDSRYLMFFCTMLLHGGMGAPALAEQATLNNLLINTPLGAGTCNMNGYPGTPGSAPWFTDLAHITRQGQGWCADKIAAAINPVLNTL